MRKLGFVLMALLCMTFAVSAFAAEKGEITFGLDGGLASPMGDFSDFAKMGFGGGVYADYWLMPAFAIGVDGSYSKFNIKDDYMHALEALILLETGETVTVDGSVSAMQFGAHGKYMFPMKDAPVAPWISVGGGFYNVKSKIDVTGDILGGTLSTDDTVNKPGVNAALGLNYKMSPAFTLGAKVGIHDIFTESKSTQYFTAGITLGFSTAAQTTKAAK
jgi:hypothetical protein